MRHTPIGFLISLKTRIFQLVFSLCLNGIYQTLLSDCHGSRLLCQFEVNQQCARIPPADFLEAVTKTAFMLPSEDLSATWHVPTFRQKCALPTWVQQVLALRNNPQALPNAVACINQIELATWTRMSCDDIRSIISRPGKRFIAAYKRSKLLLQHMKQFVELAPQGNCNLTHLFSPSWSSTHMCFCCRKTVPVGAQPWALQVTCKAAACPAVQILEHWRNEFRAQTTLLRGIISTLQLRCPD